MSMNKSFFVALLHIVNAYFMNSLQYGYEMCVDLIYFKHIVFALCENNNAKMENLILIFPLGIVSGTCGHLYPISGNFSGVRYPN